MRCVKVSRSGILDLTAIEGLVISAELGSPGVFSRTKGLSNVSDSCLTGRIFVDVLGDEIKLRINGVGRILQFCISPDLLEKTLLEDHDVSVGSVDLRRLDAQIYPGMLKLMCRAFMGGDLVSAEAKRTIIALLVDQSKWTSRNRGLTPARLRRVKELVASDPRTVTLADMASAAALSPFHFARQFKQETGLTPHEFVTGQRVWTAVERLGSSNAVVGEIATGLGFAHASHMTRAFRRLLGTTPHVLRRDLLP